MVAAVVGINRWAAKVDGNQGVIVRALRKAGVQVWIIRRPVDLMTLWAGLYLPLEVKPEDWNGKFSSKEQEEACTVYGIPVVKNPLEALRAVGVL